MPALQIYDPRERALVAAADAVLAVAGGLARVVRARTKPTQLRRILLMRLERIGDLLMAVPAILGFAVFTAGPAPPSSSP